MFRRLSHVFLILIVMQFAFFYENTEASVYGNKVSENRTKVSPEVSHIQRQYQSGDKRESVNVLDINLNDSFTQLKLGLPNPLNSLKTTTFLANQYNAPGHRVVGAVNASFFLGNGMPANLLAENNKIINYGILGENLESPTQEPVAFGISNDGKAIADYYTPNLSFTINGKKYQIDRINNDRTTGKTVLYTSSKKTTGTNVWGTELIVTKASRNTKEVHFGDRITGTISKITKKETGGNAAIPSDGFVISVQDTDVGNELSKIPIGTEIELEISIDEKWMNAQYILAAGPLLVKNGKVNISMPTSSSFVTAKRARTAVAVDKTGKRVFLVTIDQSIKKDKEFTSNGTSLKDLASYLISIGASSAINLDGGGSTTMAIQSVGRDSLTRVNTPSDRDKNGNIVERKVSAILQAVNVGAYIDVSSRHWAIEEILGLNRTKLVNGYPDGTFRPEHTITRAETATIIARSLNLQSTQNASFTDVKVSHFASKDIAAVSELGIFIGREKGKFSPEGKLTRAEMAAVLTRAYELSGKKDIPFRDISENHWGYLDIQTLVANQLVEGYPDQTYRPNRQITRAEFVTLLSRVLNK